MANAIFLNHVHHYLDPGAIEVACLDDIARCLVGGPIESLTTTSDFGHVDFWFAPWPGPVPHDVNRPATELLLAATQFTASTVPLVRGRVVLTSHDSRGDVARLTSLQINQLALHTPRWRDQWVLEWRYGVDVRALRRSLKAQNSAMEQAFWERCTW